MKKSIDVEHNLENAKLVSSKLVGIPHFIFFGTLLGYVRENSVISGDDDIDFYVDRRYRKQVIKALEVCDIRFRKRKMFKRKYFMQGVRCIDGVSTLIDFYFYENNDQRDYIIENWNFSGKYRRRANALHIPKSIIFPLMTGAMQGFEVSVPADPEGCCRYLYGDDWHVPKAKGTEYINTVENNVPKMIAI